MASKKKFLKKTNLILLKLKIVLFLIFVLIKITKMNLISIDSSNFVPN
jgi:hypothetical protein